jgi:hypothetical protein
VPFGFAKSILNMFSSSCAKRSIGREVVPLALPAPPTTGVAKRIASFIEIEMELDARLVCERAKDAIAAERQANDAPAEQLEVLLRAPRQTREDVPV